MKRSAVAAVATVALLAGVSIARAQDVCPADYTEPEKVAQAIATAPSCDAAMKVFSACSNGAGGDTELGQTAQTKCESNFLAALKEPVKQSYQREIRVCDRKYRNQSGTMYRSFEAFCRAQVSQKYSQRYSKSRSAAVTE